MKKTVLSALALCVLCLAACNKDHGNPPTPPPTDSTSNLGTLKIDLLPYPMQTSPFIFNTFEVIISEPGGKILLDSIVPANTPLSTALLTNATLVNLTIIDPKNYNSQYQVVTFQGVNPTKWTGAYVNNYYAPLNGNKTVGHDTLSYKNLPIDFGLPQFSQGIGSGWSGYYLANTFTTYFDPVPGKYAYLVSPTLALYKIYQPQKTNDTVDCSNMDTAISTTFNSNPNYANTETDLYGYTDSTNPATALWLYNNFSGVNNLPQIVYPLKYIQKYALFAGFSNNNQDAFTFYNYGPTVPTDLTYPAANAYNLTATQNTQFSLSWNTTKPSYYTTTWSDANIYWKIYASPDSSTLNPINFLTAQKSKMLTGIDFTALKLTVFSYENILNYNYATFLNMACDSTAALKNNITSTWLNNRTF